MLQMAMQEGMLTGKSSRERRRWCRNADQTMTRYVACLCNLRIIIYKHLVSIILWTWCLLPAAQPIRPGSGRWSQPGATWFECNVGALPIKRPLAFAEYSRIAELNRLLSLLPFLLASPPARAA